MLTLLFNDGTQQTNNDDDNDDNDDDDDDDDYDNDEDDGGHYHRRRLNTCSFHDSANDCNLSKTGANNIALGANIILSYTLAGHLHTLYGTLISHWH